MNLIAIEQGAVGMGVTLLHATTWIDDHNLPVGVAFPISVEI